MTNNQSQIDEITYAKCHKKVEKLVIRYVHIKWMARDRFCGRNALRDWAKFIREN